VSTLTNSDKVQGRLFAYRGQEMAGTVVYLASRAGGYVNGQEIVIDGGYLAVNPSTA